MLALALLRHQVAATSQVVAPGIMDPFIARAASASNRRLGINSVTPMSSMGTYDSDVLADMVDGDPGTFNWSGQSPNSGTTLGRPWVEPEDQRSIDATIEQADHRTITPPRGTWG